MRTIPVSHLPANQPSTKTHTHKAYPSFRGRGPRRITQEMFVLDAGLALKLPLT